MRTMIAFAGLVLIALAGTAAAQKRDPADRALGTELNRERAETRIERLRQDQRQQRDERPAARAQKIQPSGTSTQQQPR
jgi:hypothetical protein